MGDLFLLDAEQAASAGRFREAVLFCWSTIDAVFNQKYDALLIEKLAEEWTEGRASLGTRGEVGLRTKMSALLYLVAQRSLFREPNRL